MKEDDRSGTTSEVKSRLSLGSGVHPKRSRKAAASARLAGHVRDSHASRISLRRDGVIIRTPSGVTRTCSGFNRVLLTFPVFQFAAGFPFFEVEIETCESGRLEEESDTASSGRKNIHGAVYSCESPYSVGL